MADTAVAVYSIIHKQEVAVDGRFPNAVSLQSMAYDVVNFGLTRRSQNSGPQWPTGTVSGISSLRSVPLVALSCSLVHLEGAVNIQQFWTGFSSFWSWQ